MVSLIENINSPQDLKGLSYKELEIVAQELRDFILGSVSITGGHLAPSLGVVELTLALHYVFNTPKDKIVWDVGHQAYVHKLLTGRRERFHTLRQLGGISGFPKRSESEYDTFGVGHASTSVSAALGMACARDINKEDYNVLAIIGDGSLSGGLAFEGLNQSGHLQKSKFTVILNDNKMSIAKNVGALSNYLNSIITAPLYNKVKKEVWDFTGKLDKFGNRVRILARQIEESLKNLIVPGFLFEELGFRYFGPLDGHNLPLLIKTLSSLRDIPGPTLLHIITQKGKGYEHAENDATRFHGLGAFDKVTGASLSKSKIPSYTSIFGDAMIELAEKYPEIVAITAAMPDGTGLRKFGEIYPDRFFDVGIAEEHAITFAAGLATKGIHPIAAIYSSFLQRSYDQIIHDVALQNLPVIFCLDRAGIVGEDGPTHHGVFDLSYLRTVPKMIVMSPKDEQELRDMLYTAINYDGPIAIRYPRGAAIGVELKKDFTQLPIGKAEILRDGDDILIWAIGSMVYPALEAAKELAKDDIHSMIINARFVKPLDKELLLKLTKKISNWITIEENVLSGGFGSAILEELEANQIYDVRVQRIGLPDVFIEHGKPNQLCELVGLSAENIIQSAYKMLNKTKKKNKSLKVGKVSSVKV